MLIHVKRERLSPSCGGIMEVDGLFYGYTLERPWLNNTPLISAIPQGAYPVSITFSNKFKKDMIEIQNVPGRAGIRIHNANWWSQLNGCLAIARQRYPDDHISGGLAQDLMGLIQQAKNRGETVTIQIDNPEEA